MYTMNMIMRSTPSIRFSVTAPDTKGFSHPIAAVGSSTNTPMAKTSAISTDKKIISCQTPFSPILPVSQVSKRPGSYSSSSSSIKYSATSADHVRVFVPSTRDITKETTPRRSGILVQRALAVFLFVFIWIRPSGSRTAMAVRSIPRIMTPSRTACPPIGVGHAPFRKILLMSIF